MLPEPIQVTLQVTKVFETLKIPYLIGGSFASAVHGVVRTTLDVDIIADIQPGQVESLVDLLEDRFYLDQTVMQQAVQERSSFNLIHLGSMFKVDVFLLKPRLFDQNQMARKVVRSVGDDPSEQAFFSTAEDIILAKLEWFRDGGEVSDRQWLDILGILRLQGQHLNIEDLRQWAEKLGVLELFERALIESSS